MITGWSLWSSGTGETSGVLSFTATFCWAALGVEMDMIPEVTESDIEGKIDANGDKVDGGGLP